MEDESEISSRSTLTEIEAHDDAEMLTECYGKEILHKLNEYRRSNNLCDVKVVVQGREFPAHKAVLAAGGGYFGGLFSLNMKERYEEIVHLNELDSDIMDEVLNYIYTGEIALHLGTAQLIAFAADFLLLAKLKDVVDRFMSRNVDDCTEPSELFSLYLFSIRYEYRQVQLATEKCIKNNLEVALQSKDFLNLPEKNLHVILENEGRIARDEEVVCRAILEWAKHKEERSANFYEMFSKLDITELSEDYLRTFVMQEPLVKRSPSCLSLIAIQHFDVVKDYSEFYELSVETIEEIISCDHLFVSWEEVVLKAVINWVKYKNGRQNSFYNLLTHIHFNSVSKEYLLALMRNEALFSSDSKCLNLLKVAFEMTYDPLSLTEKHPRHCLDDYTNVILVFPKEKTADVVTGPLCYLPTEKKWLHIPVRNAQDRNKVYGMPVCYEKSVFVVSQQPYTIQEDRQSLSVHLYNPTSMEWRKVNDVFMKLAKYSVSCLQGKIYVIGGNVLYGDLPLASRVSFICDVASPTGNGCYEATKVASMNEARASPCTIADDKYLYVLGGIRYGEENEEIPIHTMERYDPENNSWEYMASMKARNHSNGHNTCSLFDNKIFLLQGFSMVSVILEHSVPSCIGCHAFDVYCIATNTWFEIPFSNGPYIGVQRGLLVVCDKKLYHVFSARTLNTRTYEDGVRGEVVPFLASKYFDFKSKSWKDDSNLTMQHVAHAYSFVPLGGLVVRMAKKDLIALQPPEEANLGVM